MVDQPEDREPDYVFRYLDEDGKLCEVPVRSAGGPFEPITLRPPYKRIPGRILDDADSGLGPGDSNAAFRLFMVAKRCGPEILYDPERFDRALRVGSFAAIKPEVLEFARGLAKRLLDGRVESRVADPEHQVDQVRE